MINALRYTEDLEKAGFTPEQAKSSVKIWMDLMNDNFATKADLKEQDFNMKTEFQSVRSDLSLIRSDMRDLESRMTIKLGGMMVVAIGIISVIGKL